MTILIFVVIFFVIAIMIGGPIVYLHSRNLLREQKNYERGLKMVPLLIHLPPPSDDKEGGGRDERELIDENISKAQIMYGIINSTWKKGFKSKFYGQRHFAFEIVGLNGFVKFYAAVPVAMVEVVKQAVISAYPTARLEEVSEHNIFSPVGKISGTIGGELTLKESFAYPIATYQDIKRDPIQSLLNAMSELDNDDGVGIQILMRPANPDWRKQASEKASKKRKGNEGKKPKDEAFWWIKQIFAALWKPPEDKGGKEGGSDKPELSNLEQAVLDAIDDKTRHPGYETMIRVVASSNVSHKAQSVLNHVVASFSLFDAPGKNGFKFTPAKDIDSFVTSYILRFFPPAHNQNILNSVELAGLFHFPDQKNIPTSQLQRQESKQVDAPRNIPPDGLLLGYNLFRGAKKPIRLALSDRQRHMYVVGQTGTGKSTFLENLALQDMLNGEGFAFIDPHGDVAEKLLSMVPKERTEDVLYFCPSDMDYPMGLNMFEFHTPEQKDFLIQESINMLYKLYDPNRQGIIGPRFERIFTNAALLLMSDPKGGTFVDIPKLLIDANFMKSKLQYVTDQNVLDFWTKEWSNSQRSNEAGEVTSWVVSKFGAFLSNEMMRNIIGQTKSSFNIREVMDNKKILLVNLSKGKTGDINSRLLGMIFVMKFQAAAMSRANIPEHDRVDFCLYVDEFQNFSTDSFATIMSEARKYRLNLIVANQFTTQLTDEIRDAVFGNMGTIVAFRIGQNDVDSLTRYFQPLFDGDDLLRVPNFNTIVRTLIGGVPTQPFSMATLPTLGTPNEKLGLALKQLSAAKYGSPKAKIEADIFSRLASPEPTKPSMGPASPFSGAAARPGAYASMPTGGVAGTAAPRQAAKPSFLDEWLAKKKVQAGAVPARAGSAVPAQPRVVNAAPATQISPTPVPQPPVVAPVGATTIPTQPQAVSQQPAAKPVGLVQANINTPSVQSATAPPVSNNPKTETVQSPPPLIPVQSSTPAITNDGEVDLSQLHAKEISIDEEGNLKIQS